MSDDSERYEQVLRLAERAQSLIGIGRSREAIDELHRGLSLSPENSYLFCLLAHAHHNLEQFDTALDFAERAIKADPEFEMGHRLRSICLAELDRGAEALQSAQEAVRLSPDNEACLITLAQAQLSCEQHKEARDTALRLRELEPDSLRSHLLIGLVALKQKCWREAEEHYLRALRIDPNSYEALNNIGVALLNLERKYEASDYFKQAARLNPQAATARRNLKRSVTRIFSVQFIVIGIVLSIPVRLYLEEQKVAWWLTLGCSLLLTYGSALILNLTCSPIPSLRTMEYDELPPGMQEAIRAEHRREWREAIPRMLGGLSLTILLWWLMLWWLDPKEYLKPISWSSRSVFALLCVGALFIVVEAARFLFRIRLQIQWSPFHITFRQADE